MSDNIHARITGDAQGLIDALGKGGRAVEDFGRKVPKDLARVTEAAKETTTTAQKLSSALKNIAVGGVAVAALKRFVSDIRDMSSEMLQAQVQADKLRNTLTFSVGKAGAAQEMQFVRDTTRELGLEFVSTAQSYARLAAASRGTNMEGRATREVFTAITQASVVMGMRVEETEGALRAVQQMMSKGKVQAEELRGQLGERLPAAFHIAARAMGVTTGQLDKMLERGEVFAEDFLPRFAAQIKSELGDAVQQSATSAQSGINRYTNAITGLKQSFAQSGVSQFIGEQMAILADGMASVSERMDRARESGSGFAGQMGAAAVGVGQFLNPLHALGYSAQESGNRLDEARKRLQELTEAAKLPENWGNSFLPAAIKETRELIVTLEEARRKQRELKGDFGAGGGRGVVNPQTVGQLEAVKEKDRAVLEGMAQRLSGQGQNFQRDLAELFRLYSNGTIQTVEEYRRLMAQLIDKDGGVKKAIKDATNPTTAVFGAISERTAVLREELATTEKLTAAEKFAIKVRDDLTTGTLKATPAERARLEVALQSMLAEDKAVTQREKAKKQAEELAKLQADNVKIIEKNTDAVFKAQEARDKLLATEAEANTKLADEIVLIGLDEKGRTSRLVLLEREHIARLELDAIMARNIDGNQAEVSALEREITLREKRIDLIGQKSVAETTQRALDESKAATADIARALTDNLMRGGKSFFDYLKDTARTTVLRPIIQAVMTPVAGAIQQVVGGALGGGGGVAGSLFGGSGGMLGSIQNGVDIFNTGGIAGIGNTLGFGSGSSIFTQFATGGIGEALGLSTTVDVIGGIGTASTALTGAGSAFATAMPWIGAALAVASLLDSGGGGPKDTGSYGSGFLGDTFTRDDTQDPFNVSARAIVDGIGSSYKTAAKTLGFNAGDLQSGAFFAVDNKGEGDAPTQLRTSSYLNGKLVYDRNNANSGGNYEDVGRSPEELQAAINDASARALLSAIKASDLPAKLQGYFDDLDPLQMSAQQIQQALDTAAALQQLLSGIGQLGAGFTNITALTLQQTAALADQAGGMDALASGVQAFNQAYFSDEERFAALLDHVNVTMAGLGQSAITTKDQFRELLTGLDLATDEGTTLYAALLRIAPAFAQVHGAVTVVLTGLNNAAATFFANLDAQKNMDQYRTDGASALDVLFGAQGTAMAGMYDAQINVAESAQEAARAAADSWRGIVGTIHNALESIRAETEDLLQKPFDALYAQFKTLQVLARGGDADAAERLSGVAQRALAASESQRATEFEYLRDRSRIANGLDDALAEAQSQLTVQEAIAAAQAATVSQLQQLNASLSGFAGQALALLQGGGYTGADRDTATLAVNALAQATTDFGYFFANAAEGDTVAGAGGATFTRLSGDGAAFTGADGVSTFFRASENIIDIAKRNEALRAYWDAQYGIKLPAFEGGGMHMGGVRLVGERGPEIEITGPARYLNNSDTRAFLSGQAGGGDLVGEVAGLRDDMQRQSAAVVSWLVDIGRTVEDWELNGLPGTREVA